ncbi:hypothetical protein [Pseudomonas sp. SDO52101_S400]
MATPDTPADPLSADETAPDSALIDKPDVPAVLDPDDPRGLLPLSALGDDLVVLFEDFGRGPVQGESDLVELGFMSIGTSFRKVDERWFPTSDLVSFPQTLKVPKDLLSAGVYEVALRVSIYGSNPNLGARKTLTIDTGKPNFGNKPAAVIFPHELNGTITEAFLAQEGEVRVTVPWYNDAEAKDRAPYFWTDKENPPDSEKPIREQEFSAEDVAAKSLRITVYADEIRAWGSGKRFLYYYLRDWPGNSGPISYLADIMVDLTPAPGALPPPRVQLSSRGRVDRQHARDRLWVLIDEYDFADSQHWAAVDWDGTPLDEFPVDPSDFPLEIPVPWSKLHANGDGPLRAKVSYRIRQGSTYSPPSPDISVPVDLSLAGQDHDKAPARLNEKLALVEVYGEKSQTKNTLLSEDHGFPATIRFVLFDDPEPGDWIDFFWGLFPGAVVRYDVKAGDFSGKTIEVQVPWPVIDTDKQNPALPVHYITSNDVNEQQSLPTSVVVNIVQIENLKEPEFPDGGKQGVLNCCARPRLWEGVRVRVLADPRIEQGDRLVIVWQGCSGPNGTSPIAGAYDEIVKDLVSLLPGADIDIVVTDYPKLIEPMVNNGSALVYYRLEKSNGGRGRSCPEFVVINRTMPSGEVCSPTNDICEEN